LGLDTDTAAVARARRRYRCDARKRFLIADAAVMDFPANFFDVGLVHGIAEPSRASLDAIARATQGPIVLVQPARASLESLRHRWRTRDLASTAMTSRVSTASSCVAVERCAADPRWRNR